MLTGTTLVFDRGVAAPKRIPHFIIFKETKRLQLGQAITVQSVFCCPENQKRSKTWNLPILQSPNQDCCSLS